MKTFVKFLLLLPFVSPVVGCGDGPPPEIPPSVSACEGSCIIFDHYDCKVESENGNIELCTDKCERVARVGYLWVDDSSGPQCVVKAKSLGDVRACNVRCVR